MVNPVYMAHGKARATILFHFDGPNESDKLLDSGMYGMPVVAHDGVKLSNEQSKFGGTSLKGAYRGYVRQEGGLDRTNSILHLANRDFTMETWAYLTATNPRETVFFHVGNTFMLCLFGNSFFSFYWRLLSSTMQFTGVSHTPTLNTWTHYAVCRSAGVTRMFVNGVVIGTLSVGNIHPPETNMLEIANNSAGFSQEAVFGPQHLNGYMDEMRIVVGEAMYTAAFTPASTPFVGNERA